MATGAVAPPPPLVGARRVFSGRGVLHRRLAATPMKDEPVVSTNGGKEENVTDSLNVARKASHPGLSSSLSNQITVIASWLRAEDRYEDQSGDRHVESLKRKFASQEFHALKTRCSKQVKNDDIKRNVLNSVVGTLAVCVRHPLHGEKFPMEPGKLPFHCRIYQPDQPKFGYLTNVCVAKYARRQGIASNMLLLAIDAARLNGAENIYIHVHKDNLPARRLYDEIGFKKVDMDGARQSSDLCLLSFSS